MPGIYEAESHMKKKFQQQTLRLELRLALQCKEHHGYLA